jgi:hypothetical protein
MDESTIREPIGRVRLSASKTSGAVHDPDTLQAAAQVLAALSDPHGNILPADALRVLIQKNHRLLSDDEAIADSLTLQIHLLEATWLRYTAKAECLPRLTDQHLAMRTALAAQRQLLTALGALHQIRCKSQALTAIEASTPSNGDQAEKA